MNNDKLKGTTSSFGTTGRRPSATGKLKLPKKDIQPVVTLQKKTFLKEYSLAMESKLQSLKEKIHEKKKQKPPQQQLSRAQKQSSQIQNFLKTKTSKQSSNKFEQKLIISQLQDFLTQNNFLIYKKLLLENQIDSLQILGEATQKELQQIGIPKGHALKLKVNINKLLTAKRPQTEQKGKFHPRENKTKDTDRNKSFVSTQNNENNATKVESINNISKQLQSICIGTQQDGIESITFVANNKQSMMNKKPRSKFCLFCYQSITLKQQSSSQDISQFCSQDCSQRYNQMFKIYENNLIKAQQEFKNQKYQSEQNEEDNQQQQNNVFDLFDEQQIDEGYEDFDYEAYQNLRKQLTQ